MRCPEDHQNPPASDSHRGATWKMELDGVTLPKQKGYVGENKNGKHSSMRRTRRSLFPPRKCNRWWRQRRVVEEPCVVVVVASTEIDHQEAVWLEDGDQDVARIYKGAQAALHTPVRAVKCQSS